MLSRTRPQLTSAVTSALRVSPLLSQTKLPSVALTHPAPFYLTAIVPALLPAFSVLRSALHSLTQCLLQVTGQMTLVSSCLTLSTRLLEVVTPCPEPSPLTFHGGTSFVCCSACLFHLLPLGAYSRVVETIDTPGLHCQAFRPSLAASSCGFSMLQAPLFNTCTQHCSEGPVNHCVGGI